MGGPGCGAGGPGRRAGGPPFRPRILGGCKGGLVGGRWELATGEKEEGESAEFLNVADAADMSV